MSKGVKSGKASIPGSQDYSIKTKKNSSSERIQPSVVKKSDEKYHQHDIIKEPIIVQRIINVIRFVVVVTVLLLWTSIGFIIWIPLLIRMIAYFSGMITISTFRKTDVREAQNRLNFAIEFYINGFKKVVDVWKRDSGEEIKLKDNKPLSIIPLLKSLAIDIVWTIIFWTITILWFYDLGNNDF